MTEQSIRQEAERLYEQMLEELRVEAEREQEREREQGIRSTIRELQEQRRQERMEQARQEAEHEARRLGRLRHAKEVELEGRAHALLDSLEDLKTLDSQHRAALREAGRTPGHEHSLATIVPRWFSHRFGGFNSITGVAGTHPTGQDRTLAARDPLAEPGTEQDRE